MPNAMTKRAADKKVEEPTTFKNVSRGTVVVIRADSLRCITF